MKNEEKIFDEKTKDKFLNIKTDEDCLMFFSKTNEDNCTLYSYCMEECVKKSFTNSAFFLIDAISCSPEDIKSELTKQCVRLEKIEILAAIINKQESGYFAFQVYMYSLRLKKHSIVLNLRKHLDKSVLRVFNEHISTKISPNTKLKIEEDIKTYQTKIKIKTF